MAGTAAAGRRVHPMVRINYAIRVGSFAFSFLVLGLHGYERGSGLLFWLLLAAQFLVYPQLAYLRALRSADPKRAEEANLFLDAAFLGAWMAALQFPLWLAYAAFFSTTLNGAVVRGVRGALVSTACFAAGAAALCAIAGFGYSPDTGPLVTALAFLGSAAYSSWIGWVVWSLRRTLTARRNELRESETRFRLIAENAADLIGMIDQDGRWLYTSSAYARMLAPADLDVGVDAFVRAHPDDAARARLAVARAAGTGKPRDFALRLVDRAGRVRQLKSRVQAIEETGPSGAPRRLVLLSQDVTDLRESEERLLLAAHALEGMTEAILITAADGTVLTVNRAFSEITGYGRSEVLGQNEAALRHALQPAAYYDELYARVNEQGYWSGTTWSRRKNGSVYREWRSVRAVRGSDGAPTHFVSVFYEVGAGGQGGAAAEPMKA